VALATTESTIDTDSIRYRMIRYWLTAVWFFVTATLLRASTLLENRFGKAHRVAAHKKAAPPGDDGAAPWGRQVAKTASPTMQRILPAGTWPGDFHWINIS
jgi:hypothetical protein